MMEWIALLCLVGAVALLIAMSWVDLQVRLLPDVMTLPFALLGVAFHAATSFEFLRITDIAIGGAGSFAILYFVHFTANRLYGQDAFGLGDVKLMGGAGLWLGLNGAMLALTVGALAAALHGLGHAAYDSLRHKTKFDLKSLQVPAGPGFAVGIVIAGFIMFQTFRVNF